MRSPTGAGSATCCPWWITTPAGWWGRAEPQRRHLARFFDALGTDRALRLTHVSTDGAEWIHDVVAARARRCCSPGQLPRGGLGKHGPGRGMPRDVQLRQAFATGGDAGKRLVAGWLSWARRPLRGHQHPPAAAYPPHLRLPQPRSTHRHGQPHPRRPLPTTPRTIMKLGGSRFRRQ
jgi:hypothetical protein